MRWREGQDMVIHQEKKKKGRREVCIIREEISTIGLRVYVAESDQKEAWVG